MRVPSTLLYAAALALGLCPLTNHTTALLAPGPATSRPSTLSELKQQRLAVAKMAAQVAENLFVQGMLPFDEYAAWIDRVTQFERERPPERVAILRQRIQMMTRCEDIVTKHFEGGLCGELDVLTARYYRIGTEIALADATTRPTTGPSLPELRLQTAHRGFRMAVQLYRAGQVPQTQVGAWLERGLESQRAVRPTKDGFADWVAQAKGVEDEVDTRFRGGLCGEVDVECAKAMRIDAEIFLAQAEDKSDEVRELYRRKVEAVSQLVKVNERRYTTGQTGFADVSWSQLELVEAKIDWLRATGKADQIQTALGDMLKIAGEMEAIANTLVKAGLRNQLDQAAASWVRLSVEIRLVEFNEAYNRLPPPR